VHVSTKTGEEFSLDTFIDNSVTSAEEILPDQTDKEDYVLSSNGTSVEWQEPCFVRNTDGDITTFGVQTISALNQSLENFIAGNE
jgi:hypothetical protein